MPETPFPRLSLILLLKYPAIESITFSVSFLLPPRVLICRVLQVVWFVVGLTIVFFNSLNLVLRRDWCTPVSQLVVPCCTSTILRRLWKSCSASYLCALICPTCPMQTFPHSSRGTRIILLAVTWQFVGAHTLPFQHFLQYLLSDTSCMWIHHETRSYV